LRWSYHESGHNKIGSSCYTNIKDEDGNYDGLTGWVFATGKPLCINDITNDVEINQYENLKWTDKHSGYDSSNNKELQKHFMAVPIYSCRINKEVIGVLRIGSSKKPKPFKEEDLLLLQAYSNLISGLLTNYLLQENERALVERILSVANQADFELLLEEVVKTLPVLLDGSHCSIFFKDENGDFCLEASSAPNLFNLTKKRANKSCLKYKKNEGKTGTVACTGCSIRVDGNIESEAKMSPNLCESGSALSAAFICVAIKSKNEDPYGVIRLVRELRHNEKFNQNDQHFLEKFAKQLDIAILRTRDLSRIHIGNRQILRQPIILPKELRTPIKQYLTYFKEYIHIVQGIEVEFEVLSYADGLILEIEEKENFNFSKICHYLNEYLIFMKKNIDDINPEVETNISATKKDIFLVKLKNEVQQLKFKIEIEQIEKRLLNETIDRLERILIAARSNKTINTTYIEIANPTFNFKSLEDELSKILDTLQNDDKEANITSISEIKKAQEAAQEKNMDKVLTC